LCYPLLSLFREYFYIITINSIIFSLDTGTLPASILIMSDESIQSPPDIMETMASMAERMAQLEERLQQTSMDTAPVQDQFVVERHCFGQV
jgi:hypothetical protein